MDVEIAHHRHREEGGEEGVLATLVFPVIATGAVAGVKLDMDVGGVSIPHLSPLVRSSMVAIDHPLALEMEFHARNRQYPRSRSQIIDES